MVVQTCEKTFMAIDFCKISSLNDFWQDAQAYSLSSNKVAIFSCPPRAAYHSVVVP
jgi:hypothetical protein